MRYYDSMGTFWLDANTRLMDLEDALFDHKVSQSWWGIPVLTSFEVERMMEDIEILDNRMNIVELVGGVKLVGLIGG